MNFFKTAVLTLAAGLAACSGEAALKAADGAAYYYGKIYFYSPDGKMPYNSGEAALKREISEGGGLITETATLAAAAPGMSPAAGVTRFMRRGKTPSFDVTAMDGSFSGSLIFKGPGLDSWSFETILRSGEKTTGTGEIYEGGLRTSKLVSGPGRPMLVKEDLKKITVEEYGLRLRELAPAAGAE